MELAPLLKGEVRIIQMAVERPRFRMEVARLLGGQSPAEESAWRIDPERVSLARVQIIDGTVEISDSEMGRSWEASAVNGLIEAGSLRGPARIDAALVFNGVPMDLGAVLGRVTGQGEVPANISVASPIYPVTLSADGALDWSEEGLRYAGEAVLQGVSPSEEGEALRSRWADLNARGTFDLTRKALTIDTAQFSYEATERPLILEGSGQLALSEPQSFDVAISARQIDVDRTLGGTQSPGGTTAAFDALLEALPALPRPSIPGTFRLDARGVVIGGSLIQAVKADLHTSEEGWRIENGSAVLPGETLVGLDGTLSLTSDPAFAGHARLASEQPPAFAAWWRGEVGSVSALHGFAIEADLDLGAANQEVSNIVATTGTGTVRGSIRLNRFEHLDEIFAEVNLTADRADLIEARALTELLAGNDALSGDISQMTLSVHADVLTAGTLQANAVVLEGGFEDGEWQLRRLTVDDIEGATIEASGSIRDAPGFPSGDIEALIEADDIAGAIEYLRSLAPENALVRRIAAVAPLLSPFSADVSLTLGGEREEHLLQVTGSFADTHVEVQATGQGSFENLNSLSGGAELHLDGEDSTLVLRQLGFQPPPVDVGPVAIDATLEGMLASAANLTLSGSIAGVQLDYQAQSAFQGSNVAMIGAFAAQAADVGPALLLAGIAAPGVFEGHSVTAAGQLEIRDDVFDLVLDEGSLDGQPVTGSLRLASGDGIAISGDLGLQALSLPHLLGLTAPDLAGIDGDVWSDQPLVTLLPPRIALDLELTADAFDLGFGPPASQAAVDLSFSADELNIAIEKADFAGGTLSGAIEAQLHDGEASVALRGALEEAQLHALVWERNEVPVASGRFTTSFEAAARGRSVAGLVSALSGNGSFEIVDGVVDSFNPQVLTAVMQLAQGEETPDSDMAREIFATRINAGTLPFDTVGGSFSISNGVVDLTTVSATAEQTAVRADATIDLNSLALESDWTVRVAEDGSAAESQVYVPLHFEGPLAGPSRQSDLAPLLALLNARYQQRQRERVEELEDQRREAEELRLNVEERLRQRVVPLAPASPEQPPPNIGPPLQLTPAQDAALPPSRNLVEQLAPTTGDVVDGVEATP